MLDITWRDLAIALIPLWLAGLTYFFRGLASKEALNAVIESLSSHLAEDLRRFDEVVSRIDTIAKEAKDDRHAFRNDITSALNAQNVLNVKFADQIGEIRGSRDK